MDMALCVLNKDTRLLEFSGAYNPLYLVRSGIANNGMQEDVNIRFYKDDLAEYRANRQPVGFVKFERVPFEKREIQLQPGDRLYVFSDGLSDQFGGPEGKKFSTKRLREFLVATRHIPMHEQKTVLTETLDQWQGSEEQVDDICIMGVEV